MKTVQVVLKFKQAGAQQNSLFQRFVTSFKSVTENDCGLCGHIKVTMQYNDTINGNHRNLSQSELQAVRERDVLAFATECGHTLAEKTETYLTE